MLGITVNKGVVLVLNTIIDGGLLTIILSVWSIEDYSSAIKLITTCIVGLLSIVRWVLFFKDRRNGEKDIIKTK